MRNYFAMLIITLAMVQAACTAHLDGVGKGAMSVDDLCQLSMHPASYVGKQIRLTTKLINATPHGLSLYDKDCPIPTLNVAYSEKFKRHGSQTFDNALDAYLADEVIVSFNIIALGHVGWDGGHRANGQSPRFYFDKVVSLKPDEPPIQP